VVHSGPMNDLELETKILQFLIESPGLTARELEALTGVFKGTINSLLYKSTKFIKDDSPRPCWFLKDDENNEQLDEINEELVEKLVIALKQRMPVTKRPLSESFNFDSLRQWQSEALKAWNENGRKGLVEAVTGTGKTRLGLAATAEELNLGGKVAVIVPSIELQRQWSEELQRSFPEIQIGFLGNGSREDLLSCDVLIAIVHSASQRDLGLQDHEFGLLIADECHRYGTDIFMGALEDGFKSRLGLTATRERADGGHKELEDYFGKVVYTLGYRESIDRGYIAEIKVAQIAVNLTIDEKFEFDELSEVITKSQFELSKRFGLKVDPYPHFMAEIVRIKKEGDMRDSMAAGRYLSSISRRKALLANTPQKLKVVKHLADSINESNGTLFFTETIAGAEAICDELKQVGISAATIHSGLKSQERFSAFIDFHEKRIQALTAAKVLDEGVDVPEADLAVIVSASKTRRQMIQRMGRVIRVKADGRKARFVFVYVANTSEDPSSGAHDEFWNEVLNVATSSEHFDLPNDAKKLTDFLKPDSTG
jgi:RNA polymerase primary sigma factor